jgi:hypothetical protein
MGNDRQLERCCPHHGDWAVLREHLVASFPTLDPVAVVEEVDRAKAAVERFGLQPPEGIDTAEMVARNQLLLVIGERHDSCRLNPETHQRTHPDAASG